jgi:small conductance mechanosensitive channel
MNWLFQYGIRILIIIALALALYYLLRHFIPITVRTTLSRTMKGRTKTAINERADTLSAVFVNAGATTIVIIAICTILVELGINVAPALAGLGIVGVAIGFGAQSLVKDIFNGLFILLENQYNVGDVIKIAGVTGRVEEVSLRRTVLRDLDGIVHSVPNGEVRVASNYTKEWSRVNLDVTVDYSEDLSHVIEVINSVGEEMARDAKWKHLILKAPQVLRVSDFDRGIVNKILGDTKPPAKWDVTGELRLRLKTTFDKEGIKIV